MEGPFVLEEILVLPQPFFGLAIPPKRRIIFPFALGKSFAHLLLFSYFFISFSWNFFSLLFGCLLQLTTRVVGVADHTKYVTVDQVG